MMSDDTNAGGEYSEEQVDALLEDIEDATGPVTELDATTVLTEREEREAVYRHVFMGQTYRDIGDILGVSHGTIGTVMDAYKSASGTGLETSILNQFTDVEDPAPAPDAVVLTYSGEDREVRTDGGEDTASADVGFADHGGHIYADAYGYVDLNAFSDGEDQHSLDHLVTNSGSVLIRVDGTPLSDLVGPYTHHQYDETGGVPAGGF